jgi:hypothetical protein
MLSNLGGLSCATLQVKAALAENDFTEDTTFIHCDGALAGLLLPFAGLNAEETEENTLSRKFQVSFVRACMLAATWPTALVVFNVHL